MKFIYLSLLVVFSLSMNPEAIARDQDPEVVPAVDVNRYLGLWYEIGHFPNFFQGGCVRSTAEYGLINPTRVSVKNTCFKADGRTTSIEGEAYVVDPAEPAKLEVDFGFLRKGDYWIIDLDANYQWAVVSGPGKKSLFILARTAPMDPSTLDGIKNRLNEKGFDVSRIIYDQY